MSHGQIRWEYLTPDRTFQQLFGDLADIPLKARSFQRNMWTENSPWNTLGS